MICKCGICPLLCLDLKYVTLVCEKTGVKAIVRVCGSCRRRLGIKEE